VPKRKLLVIAEARFAITNQLTQYITALDDNDDDDDDDNDASISQFRCLRSV